MDGQNYNTPQGDGNQYDQETQNSYYQDYTANIPYQSIPQPEMDNSTNGLQTAGLVLGILSIVSNCCSWIFGIIFGIIGLIMSIMGNKTSKNGIGTAGLVCSILGLIFSIIMMFISIFLVIMYFNYLGITIDNTGSYYNPNSYNDIYSIMQQPLFILRSLFENLR